MRVQAKFAPPAALPIRAPAPPRKRTAVVKPARPRPMHRGVGGLVLLAGALLAGCAALEPSLGKNWWKVEPLYRVQDSPLPAQAYLALGRYFDGSRDWERAAGAYRRALAREPELVEAYDGLGQALAHLGRLDEAEAALRHALALAPQRQRLQNNLAYVLMLAGRPAEALGPLRDVLARDPGNAIAQANLQEATARLTLASRPEPAAQTVADPAAPVMLASQAATETRDRSPDTELAQAAIGAADMPSHFSLEVSNGNGIAGMAGRVGQRLTTLGLPRARLSNQLPYAEARTVLQYRTGQEAAAQRVALALPDGVAAGTRLQPGLRSDVRLLLGQDWPRTSPCRAATGGC
ncbi:tetratricopeptide repeat protein [Roseateles sp.]|uniref:LytR C-terminal domain-containing protein n=1 Tax=Roseateles sp. TaxID=1971397 RepID=UPI0025CCD3AA|nr:tetratricopeptide repeat protein [Roseateles sp.]MBV8036211.1 tetratricopeptide repeat protein [Roseateles sp.]